MYSDAFNEIIQKAEELTQGEVVDLIAWLETRKRTAQKRTLESFRAGIVLPGKGTTKWADDLRAGWER